MNYEEKYKQALEWAKSIYLSTFGADREDLEHFFPELAESEDERIRKAILSGLKYLETELGLDAVGDIDILDAYTWLEKQDKELMLYKANESEKIRKDVIQCLSNIGDGFEADNQQQKEDTSTEYEKGRADVIENACKWLSQQGDLPEDCFSDINDFVDLFKKAMEGGVKDED